MLRSGRSALPVVDHNRHEELRILRLIRAHQLDERVGAENLGEHEREDLLGILLLVGQSGHVRHELSEQTTQFHDMVGTDVVELAEREDDFVG